MRLAVVVRLGLGLGLAVLAHAWLACSSSMSGSVAADAATTVDGATESDTARPGDDASEAGTPDASIAPDAAESGTATACVAKRTPGAAPDCSDDCDVRLLLPGGDKYCTMTCSATSACAALGDGLVCSTEVGTCVPACKTDGECVAAGWKRCDPTTGGCDTI